MTNLVGRDLGRYHVLERLDKGGLSTIYKAYDTRLERDVVVKIIRCDAFPEDQLERILKHFERETRALARLTHPNLVQVYDYGNFEGAPYLILEFVPGEILKERLKQLKGAPMPWPEAVQLLLPIAQALHYAHDQGIVHRNVKPSNILITSTGEPILSGLEVVKLLDNREIQTQTVTGLGVGTPEYVAPEQWKGEVTAKTDIYALGVVLYEMVTGRKPYEASIPAEMMMKQATQPVPQPRRYVPNLPQGLEAILLKALALKPEQRFHDMGEFIDALNTLEDLSTSSATPKRDNSIRRAGVKKEPKAGRRSGNRNGSSGGSTDGGQVPRTSMHGGLFRLQIGLVICLVMLLGSAGYLGWRAVQSGVFSPMPATATVEPTQTASLTATLTSTETITATATTTFTPIISPTRTRTPRPTLTPWPTDATVIMTAPQKVLLSLINTGGRDKVIFMDGFRLTDVKAGGRVALYIPVGAHTVCWAFTAVATCPRLVSYEINQDFLIVFSLDEY